MNALDNEENLTPLGYHLAKLPISPQLGKMILLGAIFSCVDPIVSIASCLDYKDPFVVPFGKQKEVDEVKTKFTKGEKSDHLMLYEVLKSFEASDYKREFCWENFLSFVTIKQLLEMKKQFMDYLREMKFVNTSDPTADDCNENSNNLSLVKAIICAGLYPNIVVLK